MLRRPGLWALLAASSAFYFLSGNQADNDLWMHLFVGGRILDSGSVPRFDDLSYTVTGAAWVDHEWLTQVLFAGIYRLGGSPLLLFCKLAIGLLAAACVWRVVCRHSASPWVRGVVLAAVLSVVARGFGVRPQILTYLGVAGLLVWLDPLSPRRSGIGRPASWGVEVAATAALFVLWANLHGAFIAGLALLGVRAALPPWRLRNMPLPVVGALAACVNPYGPALGRYLASELVGPHPLTEWQPAALGDPTQVVFWLLLVALVVTLPFARTLRRHPWWAVLLAGTVWMAVQHQRHTPLVALVATGPLAEQIEGAAAWLRQRGVDLSPPSRALIGRVVAVLIVLQIGLGVVRLGRDHGRLVFAAEEYPVGAVRYLLEQKLHGNIAVPLEWGGYVLWHGSPALKVSLDGRFATVYPPKVVALNFDFYFGSGPAARRLVDDYPTDIVLTPTGWPVPVRGQRDWRLSYHDAVAEVFTRPGSAALAVARAPTGRMPFP